MGNNPKFSDIDEHSNVMSLAEFLKFFKDFEVPTNAGTSLLERAKKPPIEFTRAELTAEFKRNAFPLG